MINDNSLNDEPSAEEGKNLARAIAAHRNEVLPQLCGSDLSAADERGRTLLMEAALAGNREAVKHLCAMGGGCPCCRCGRQYSAAPCRRGGRTRRRAVAGCGGRR